MSVKVGVRVRPFNKRQKQLNCKCCVQMSGATTNVHQLETGDQKTFSFDYSFWSHDRFEIDDEGVFQPIDTKYADQKKVYNEIGADILINAWQGYNCCLFAYGQTGSGKSYSMLGYGPNRGVIPMVCDNIFSKIQNENDHTRNYEVKVSMMEIYNETLRDLLAKEKKAKELKIKETKKLGVYVEGLNNYQVRSYQQIAEKIEEGSNNRSIAATLMNESSSRSHTIVSITFVQQIQVCIEQTSIKFSTIHLVDLAGSESVGKTGVDSKDRLREAAKINQSLSTLGRVIEILAENSSRTQKLFVPYRDSKLTFILRNALGGNSRTAMICAISPANDNYEETVSTLRYASRAKKIQNKAIVNQSDVDKLIRTLREENDKLKQLLKQARMQKTVSSDGTEESESGSSAAENINPNAQQSKSAGQITDDDMTQENESETTKEDKDVSNTENNTVYFDYTSTNIDENEPYITNLSEDELLSGRLKYSCSKTLTVGSKLGEPHPDIALSRLGIQPIHCRIKNDEGRLFIEVMDEKASEYTFLNGINVPKDHPTELMNCDRLIFGTGCIFLVKIPNGEIRKIKKDNEEKEVKPQDIDFAFALTEIQENYLAGGMMMKSQKAVKAEEEETRKQAIGEIQAEYDKMKKDSEEEFQKRLEEQEKQFREKIECIEKQKGEEAMKLKLELEKQETEASKLRNDKEKTQKELGSLQEMERKLQETSNVDKEELEQARKCLKEKENTINQLERNIQRSTQEMSTKRDEMEQEIKKKEMVIQKEMELKMVYCNNENIMSGYKLEQSKRVRGAKELKDVLLNSEKNEMQTVIIELIPKVERFNLMSLEMKKGVEAGFSINYNYICQSEYMEVLKNKKRKNNNIYIHIINKKEGRSYYWPADVFRNRYELAVSMFGIYLNDPTQYLKYSNDNDPYWDPPTPTVLGETFLVLEPLFYRLDFEGDLAVIRKGERVGQVHVHLFPINRKKKESMSTATMAGETLFSPHNFEGQSLTFQLELSQLRIMQQAFQVKIEYELLQGRLEKEFSNQSQYWSPGQFEYKCEHTLPDLSQAMIEQYINRPLCIKFWGNLKETTEREFQDSLTERDNVSVGEFSESSLRGSFAEGDSDRLSVDEGSMNSPRGNHLIASVVVGKSSGMKVNENVMEKIDKEYKKSNEEMQKKQKDKKKVPTQKKDKDKDKDKGDCVIF